MPTSPESETAAPPRRSRLPHPRWLLLFLVALGLIGFARLPRATTMLGLGDPGLWFLDSYAILAANDAVTAGLNPYDSIPLDILKRRHVYSDWWLGLRHLGVTRADNFIFGGSCVLGFLAVALAGLKPRSPREALLYAAVALSPPVLLGLNRANNDLIIFTLLGLPLVWLRDPVRPWLVALFGAALVAATGLKYYPVVALAALPLFVVPRRQGFWLAIGGAAAALLVLWSERMSLARGVLRFPDSVYLFGSPVLWRDLGLPSGTMIALSTAIIALAAWWLVQRRFTLGLSKADHGEGATGRWAFAVGALLLLGCFLAGTSFAYRWIFALWLCPWLWAQLRTPSRARAARIGISLLLLSVWQDGAYCLVLNSWMIPAPPWVETAWRYATQPVNWALMALLAGWLLDATLSITRARSDSTPSA